MDFFAAVKNRREITDFASTPVPKEQIKSLLEVGYLSVTGNSLPSREFILVQDREMLDHLAHATPFMPWLAKAPVGIVIIGNPDESKYWLQDATIATSNIWLAATALGLGAAWGAIHHSEDAVECGRRERFVREALGIPKTFRPVSILGVGYAASLPGEKDHYPPERVFHRERFNRRIQDLAEVKENALG